MDSMWILWGWLISIPIAAILTARYAMWANYDDFFSELGFSMFMVCLVGAVWPIFLAAFLIIITAMPSRRRKEFLHHIATQTNPDLTRADQSLLVERVKYLEHQLEKQAAKEIERLRKEYAKS